MEVVNTVVPTLVAPIDAAVAVGSSCKQMVSAVEHQDLVAKFTEYV